MQAERQQIFHMLQTGKITAEQALALFQALEGEQVSGEQEDGARVGEIVGPEMPPDMGRLRRFWQIPFFIALALLLACGVWLRSIYQSSAGAITLGFVCVWSLFLLAFALTTLAWWSRRAPWLHVRVREREGRGIAISLPLPLGLANWGVRLARSWAGSATQTQLDVAASFLEAAQTAWRAGNSEPLMVRVDDEGGDQVQVYIG